MRDLPEHILFAYSLSNTGDGFSLSYEDIYEALNAKSLCWVHLDGGHAEVSEWLSKELRELDPLIVSALVAEETRPRIMQIHDGAIIILRGVNFNSGEDAEDMVSIRLYIDKSRIISIQKKTVKAILAIENSVKSGRVPKDAGHFLTQLISQLTGRFEAILMELDEKTDDVEEKLLVDADVNLRKDIVAIRKKSILFRRHLSPQREAISQLRMAEISWLSDTDKLSLQESSNHILRYIEGLDAIRERAQIVKDELASMIADKLNRNTYVLSVIAAVFLPLGFLTGLLGVNVGGIPGSDNPAAFTIFCIFLTALVGVQIAIFRKLKWF